MRGLAAEGRTVFVSSHLMNEMAETAEHVVVIGRGALIADMPIAEFTQRSSRSRVHVVSPRADELAQVLVGMGGEVTRGTDGSLDVTGLDAAKIGDLALEHRLGVHELTPVRASLEAAFMDLTRDSVQYRPTASEVER
jgi:ABC-2 type transport system ATP-binding protein